MSPSLYRMAADLVLVAHAAFIGFVVFGLVAILMGGVRGWRWVRRPGFRWAHLAGIGVVVLQAWLGIVCPLTTLEMHWRAAAGDSTYGGTFIAHWLQRLVFFEAPLWVFASAYTAFGALVALSWWLVRPHPWPARQK